MAKRRTVTTRCGRRKDEVLFGAGEGEGKTRGRGRGETRRPRCQSTDKTHAHTTRLGVQSAKRAIACTYLICNGTRSWISLVFVFLVVGMCCVSFSMDSWVVSR